MTPPKLAARPRRRRTPPHRRATDRSTGKRTAEEPYGRRKSDFWASITRIAVVVAAAIGAFWGQGEFIGANCRHYATLVSFGALALFVLLAGPVHFRVIVNRIRSRFSASNRR